MAERNTQSAARLSEDIGDVLTAIRRLIAEDEALSAARDRVMDDRSGNPGIIDEDSAEFLARRHGGNAAMARKLARRRFGVAEPAGNDDAWPLGPTANGPDAARPRPIMPETPPSDPAPSNEKAVIRHADAVETGFTLRNDLARTLSEVVAVSRHTNKAETDGTRDAAFSFVQPPFPETSAPLRLETARRVMPDQIAAAHMTGPDDDLDAGMDQVVKFDASRRQAVTVSSHDFEALVEEDDFAEAFDWKARMRPDPDATLAQTSVAAKPAESSLLQGVEDKLVREDAASPGANDETVVARMWDAPAPLAIGMGLGEVAQFHVADAISDDGSVPDRKLVGTAKDVTPADKKAGGAARPAAADIEAEEQSIRDLLREMIQEELLGEMGQRFSSNLRAVIRREIASAIDDQLERI